MMNGVSSINRQTASNESKSAESNIVHGGNSGVRL